MKNNLDSMKYKIGIYVRESRDDNEENYETIETQRDLLLDCIRKNNLGEVVRIYIDDNESGSGFDRKGIKLLTSDVKDGVISLLVIKDLSRLGRNNAKTLLFLDFLEEYAVRVITFDGRYDSTEDNDTVGIDTWYNERYVRDISKKIRANLRFKIEKGEYIGNAPYGYIKSLKEKNKLCIDIDTSEKVKFIYKLYLEGNGYAGIAKILNSMNYPAPSMRYSIKTPSILWNAVAVKRILFNRVYIGDTVQGISEKISFKSKKTRRLTSDRWVITENTHDAIISKDDFEKVQKIRNSKKMNNGQYKGTIHLYKGSIYCGNCDSIMYARQRTGKPMAYVCSNYFKTGKQQCTSHHIREEFLTDLIKKEIDRILFMEDSKKLISEYIEITLRTENTNKNEIEKLEKILLSKQKQQEIIYMDYLEEKISEQLFIRTNQNIELRILQLKCEIEKIRSRETKKQDSKDISNCILNFNEYCITYDIIRFLIDRIVILDENDDYAKYEIIKDHGEIPCSEGAVIIYFKTQFTSNNYLLL